MYVSAIENTMLLKFFFFFSPFYDALIRVQTELYSARSRSDIPHKNYTTKMESSFSFYGVTTHEVLLHTLYFL
jgi:hypothetical protein